jgi:hypothetical protein
MAAINIDHATLQLCPDCTARIRQHLKTTHEDLSAVLSRALGHYAHSHLPPTPEPKPSHPPRQHP